MRITVEDLNKAISEVSLPLLLSATTAALIVESLNKRLAAQAAMPEIDGVEAPKPSRSRKSK